MNPADLPPNELTERERQAVLSGVARQVLHTVTEGRPFVLIQWSAVSANDTDLVDAYVMAGGAMWTDRMLTDALQGVVIDYEIQHGGALGDEDSVE